jgi:hypothetical protein
MTVKDSLEAKPTFIGIGGMRCGTTWTSECLRYHPEVFMSTPKEIHYFGYEPNWSKGREWYLAHFQGSTAFKAVGEYSVSYLQNPVAPQQIADTVGRIKIVAIIRNPVARFLSHYKYLIRAGALTKAQFQHLTIENLRRATQKYPRLITYGIYCDGLQLFCRYFGSRNLCVLLYDEIEQYPETVLEKLYGFLGVETKFRPAVVNKRVSPGIVPRVPAVERMRIRLYYVFNRSAPWLNVYSRKLRMGELYRRLNSDRRMSVFKVDEAVLDELISYYCDDISKLDTLLGQDVSKRWIERTS